MGMGEGRMENGEDNGLGLNFASSTLKLPHKIHKLNKPLI
tara:strand:+ start:49391 stop:49510 length:120 start_codon:yes stop_codon:yes gene_type:complete